MTTRTHDTSMGVKVAECTSFDFERAKREGAHFGDPNQPVDILCVYGTGEAAQSPSGELVVWERRTKRIVSALPGELRNLPTPEERLRQAGIHIVLWADDIYFPIIDGHGLLVLGRDTPKDLQGGIDGAGGWKSYDRAVTAALEWLDKQEGNQ